MKSKFIIALRHAAVWLLRIGAAFAAFLAGAVAYVGVRFGWLQAGGFAFGAIIAACGASWLLKRSMRVSANAIFIVLFIAGGWSFNASDDAMDIQAREHWTVEPITSIATAVEAYADDHQHVLPQARTLDELHRILVPAYIQELPRTDGWGYPLRWELHGNHYFIGSAGKYGVWEHESLTQYTARTNLSPSQDEIYSDANWICSP